MGGTVFSKLAGLEIGKLPLLKDIQLTGDTLDFLLIIVLLWLLVSHYLNRMSDNVLYLGSELESAYKQIGSQMRDFVELQRDMAAPEFDKADAEENATIQKRMQSLDEKFKVLLDKHAKTERKNESLSTKIIDDGLIWWNFDVPLYIGGLAVLCLAFDILYLPN